MKKKAAYLLILIVISSASLVIGLSQALAAPLQVPSIGVSPGSGLAGTTVTISGSGYTHDLPASIYWDGAFQQTFLTGSGSFSVFFVIPYGASPGTHTIRVCTGCGMGEFEQSASTTFLVLAPPTNTPTPIATNTPTRSASPTPSATPTPGGCQDRIVILSPERHARLGGEAGLPTVDLVFEVYYTAEYPLSFRITDHYGPELVTQWPDPAEGITIEHSVDPSDPTHHSFVVHGLEPHFGTNAFGVKLERGCPGRRTNYVYWEFSNGDLARGRITAAECGDLGLGSEANLISFETGNNEYLYRFAAERYGISFGGSLGIVRVEDVLTRSGTRAGGSTVGMEFGSAGHPIQMNFSQPLRALGMYVGMSSVIDVTGEVQAVLSVYGYPGASETYGMLGSSSVSFAAEPTDVLECLVYVGEPGERIIDARLDYLSGGVSIAEQRLIDDLTFVFSAEAEDLLPPDLPPSVGIVSPSGSDIYTASDIHLQAEITEDRELVRTWLQLNDEEPQPIGFLSGGDPTGYSVVTILSASSLDHSRVNTLTVIAEDSAGQRGSDSLLLTVATPVPSLDLSIHKYEFIQTVQCLDDRVCGPDNSIPMFSGKPTLLRVYLNATGTDRPVEDIRGRLCFDAGTCFEAINRATILPTDDPVAAYRGDLSGTLNFLIPGFYTGRAGDLEMVVEINPEGEILEGNYLNNNISMGVRILASNPIKIVTIGVRSVGYAPDLAAARADMFAYFEATYPTANIRYLTFAGDALIVKDYNFAKRDAFNGWSTLLTDLSLKAAFNTWSSPGPTYWHGIVDSRSLQPGSPTGMGENPGDAAGSTYDSDGSYWPDFSAATFAEEMGHNWGLSHLTGCSAGDPDLNMPIPMRLGRGRTASHQNLSWGIDLERTSYPWLMYGPDSFDFMGYCGNTDAGTITDGVVHDRQWVSAYTYKNLIRALYGGIVSYDSGGGRVMAPMAQGTADPFLIGALYVSSDSAELVRGFYRVDLRPDQLDQLLDHAEQDEFLVELRDDAGNLLYRSSFDPMRDSNMELAADEGIMMVALPWQEGAAQIVIVHQGVEIGRFAASAGIPEITLLTPNGGEQWPQSGTERIEWRASDSDRDELSYQILYSPDGGENWTSLGAEVSGTTWVEVDLARLGGSGNALVRVIATDGFNTASDDSDASFSVAEKPPQLFLLSPADGQEYPDGHAVILKALALDLEDNEVTDDAFAWTSNVDGDLGAGASLWGLELSDGTHEISVTVTDRDGNAVSRSVTITIGDEAGGFSPWWVIIPVLGVTLLGAVVVILRRRRAQ